jgi:hypothetical protein
VKITFLPLARTGNGLIVTTRVFALLPATVMAGTMVSAVSPMHAAWLLAWSVIADSSTSAVDRMFPSASLVVTVTFDEFRAHSGTFTFEYTSSMFPPHPAPESIETMERPVLTASTLGLPVPQEVSLTTVAVPLSKLNPSGSVK